MIRAARVVNPSLRLSQTPRSPLTVLPASPLCWWEALPRRPLHPAVRLSITWAPRPHPAAFLAALQYESVGSTLPRGLPPTPRPPSGLRLPQHLLGAPRPSLPLTAWGSPHPPPHTGPTLATTQCGTFPTTPLFVVWLRAPGLGRTTTFVGSGADSERSAGRGKIASSKP